MASQKDNIISPQRYIDLKNQVRAECKRRKYIGSVESYGGVTYDYTNQPSIDSIIANEHFSKNNIPLRAINSTGMPSTDTDRIITDNDMLILETKVAAFASRPIVDTRATDCSASCTGTCTTGCTNECTNGCSGGCTGGCSGGCSGGCTGGCSNLCSGCGYSCSTDCSTGCGVGCQGFCFTAECVGECEGTCYEGCYTDCGDECHSGCVSECAFCGNTCSNCCGSHCLDENDR